MADKIFAVAEKFAALIGGWAYISCIAAATVEFVTVLIISAVKCGFGRKKRMRYLPVAAVILLFIGALSALGGIRSGLLWSAVFLIFLYAAIISYIPERKPRITEEQREFARFIDSKIPRSVREKSVFEPDFSDEDAKDSEERGYGTRIISAERENGGVDVSSPRKVPASNKVVGDTVISDGGEDGNRRNVIYNLDFTHVRNVISRLDYYGLSQNDRRQVHELESYLLSAERGSDDPTIKEKINDGLSALLKIMSKYGA